MKIYGVAVLSACFLVGQLVGELTGYAVGIKGNIGGVGIGMILLIFCGDWMKKKNFIKEDTNRGVLFWSAMYIPVVIAMSATQNVKAALSGGWVAVAVGVIGTLICLLLVPVISSFSSHTKPDGND
jgi:malonate transporter MadL subunit